MHTRQIQTRRKRRAALAALALVAVMALGACRGATPPMAFYTLTPAHGDGAALSGGPAVGVGPLAIPRTIDRPHIVTREGHSRLHMAEFHRWGAPLSDDILGTLSRNIAALLGSEQVVAYPWASFMNPNYRVPVNILRLDGTLGGEVVLEATWGVAARGKRKAEAVRTFHTRIEVEGDGYPALVRAHDAALGALSTAIADAIKALEAKK